MLKIEVLRNLTGTWRTCRSQYPGWVIAPANTREQLWEYTKNWLDVFPSSLPNMPADEALLLTSEAFWRLDTSLSPMTIGQAEMAGSVLERINPAPDQLTWPSAPEYNATNTMKGALLSAWVSVAFAIMREAREDLDIVRFELWLQRLRDISQRRPDWLARWHYEHSLIALWQLDFDRLESALSEWPTQLAQLPFWEIRRAALWSELGDIQQAANIAKIALETIRSRTKPGGVDYQNLSEEGWAMRLLMALRHSRVNSLPESERARFQDRFSDLARYKCNPWDVIDWFELALKAPRPQSQPAKTETTAFDPGGYTTHYGDSEAPFERARPAFGYLRVVEQGAIPLRVGILALLSDELKQIPLWIAPFAFSWAVAIAVRADEEHVVEVLLDRTNIATLSREQASNLAGWLTGVCERSIGKLSESINKGWDRALPERIVGAVTEALSRLILRVEPSQAERIVALAEEICRIDNRSVLFSAMKHVDAIFERAITWFVTPGRLGSYLANWLQLPLPSEIGGREEWYGERAEPFRHIRIRHGMRWQRPTTSAVADRIQKLLDVIATSGAADRNAAALRLVVVASLHGLTITERRKLKDALWARTDATTGLPVETGIRLSWLLRYCPVSPDEWRKKLKRAFLETSVPRIRIPSEDGKGFTFDHRNASRWAANLQDISIVPWSSRGDRRFGIDWDAYESEVLLTRMDEWWQEEKGGMEPSVAGRLFLSDPIKSCAETFVDILGAALIPKLPLTAKDRLLAFLDSMAASGIDTLPARPATIRFNVDPEQTRQELLNHLSSVDPTNVRNACDAIKIWIMLRKAFRWLAEPNELVDALIWKIAFRRAPALPHVISTVAYLLEQRALRLKQNDIARLVATLDSLVQETALPQALVASFLSTGDQEVIPYGDRPHHRYSAARLARALGRYHARSRQDQPATIERWRKLSENNPLPEFRKLWAEEDDEY